MTRDLLYREGIGSSLTEPRQKRVTQRVYHAVIWKLQTVPELLLKTMKVRLTSGPCGFGLRTRTLTCSPTINTHLLSSRSQTHVSKGPEPSASADTAKSRWPPALIMLMRTLRSVGPRLLILRVSV